MGKGFCQRIDVADKYGVIGLKMEVEAAGKELRKSMLSHSAHRQRVEESRDKFVNQK